MQSGSVIPCPDLAAGQLRLEAACGEQLFVPPLHGELAEGSKSAERVTDGKRPTPLAEDPA